MTATTTFPKHGDRGMEGMVAKWYASSTGKSKEEFVRLAERVSAELPEGSAVLEVAPGPGYFAIELAKCGRYSIAGLDISHTFVEIARGNAATAGVRVDFRQGNASHMPFANDSFDFLLCRAAFKNFGEPVQALKEMARVLKPGGRGMIIDLKHEASMDSINQHVEGMHLGAASKVMTKLTFRFMLLKSAYTRQQFEQMLAQANFGSAHIDEGDIGFEILVTKKDRV